MILQFVVEGPFLARPSFFRSRVVTRFAWLFFAVSRVKVSEHEYATTAFDWIGA
jgi:hypothetical protein